MRMLLVHGGVSGVARPERPELTHAHAAAATARLAPDVVELAVRALEDDERLNAGYGSVLNRSGYLELDAGIADGRRGKSGAVANVVVRHPISLARRVLEHTPHVLMTGGGAAELGADMELLTDTSPAQRERWLEAHSQGRLGTEDFGGPEHVDTVGAVALDEEGNLAAASSTGGVFGKLPGRVGDAPVFGAGFYASAAAAVVGTGVGELFIEMLAAFRTGELIERGVDPQSACERVVEAIGRRGESAAGLLAIDGSGSRGAAFRGGSWTVEGPDGPVDAARLS